MAAAETAVQFPADPAMDGCVDSTGSDDVSRDVTRNDVTAVGLLSGLDDVSDGLRQLVATSRGGGSSGSASLSSASSHETVVSVGARQPETRDHPPDHASCDHVHSDRNPEQPKTVCCNGGDQSAENGDEVFHHSEMSVMSPLVNRWRRRQQAEAEHNSASGPPYFGWSNNRSDPPRFVEATGGRCTHGYSSDTEAFLRTLNRRGTTACPAVTTSGQSVNVSGRCAGQSSTAEYGSWQRDWSTNLQRTSSPTSTAKQLEVCAHCWR